MFFQCLKNWTKFGNRKKFWKVWNKSEKRTKSLEKSLGFLCSTSTEKKFNAFYFDNSITIRMSRFQKLFKSIDCTRVNHHLWP